jgi:hypothetical protein
MKRGARNLDQEPSPSSEESDDGDDS